MSHQPKSKTEPTALSPNSGVQGNLFDKTNHATPDSGVASNQQSAEAASEGPRPKHATEAPMAPDSKGPNPEPHKEGSAALSTKESIPPDDPVVRRTRRNSAKQQKNSGKTNDESAAGQAAKSAPTDQVCVAWVKARVPDWVRVGIRAEAKRIALPSGVFLSLMLQDRFHKYSLERRSRRRRFW